MSYILDALKKLEHEKTKKNHRQGMISISGALFENERTKPTGVAGWKIVLAVMAAVLMTFTATWFLLQPAKQRENNVPRLAPPPSAAPASSLSALPVAPPPHIEPAPIAPVAVAVAVSDKPATPKVPAAPAKDAAIRPPAQVSKPTAVTMPPATANDDAAALLTMQELRKRTKDRKGLALSANQVMAAPADIKLSGIAWQDERRARRAVVNGFLMQEGGVISGAKITDIYQDRVRFSLSGKAFEIPLVSSGISAAGN